MKNYTITVNGNVYDVVVEEGSSTPVALKAVTAPVATQPVQAAKPVAQAPAPAPKASEAEGSVKIEAGAAGKIFKLVVKVGQSVKSGDTVLILEAMKMEIPIVAPQDGIVASLNVAVGDAVEAGAVLATLN